MEHFLFHDLDIKDHIARHTQLSKIAQCHGFLLSRQSERNLPRARFSTSILNPKMKEGKDYAGMILCLVLALLSARGRFILTLKRKRERWPGIIRKINARIKHLEFVLFMEEFLKHGGLRMTDMNALRQLIDDFVTSINKHTKRNEGMDTCLIKNHLYFHLPQQIEMWGPLSLPWKKKTR